VRGGVAHWIWMILKLCVAGGIVWFLLSQGKLDLSLFLEGAIDANIIVVAMLCNFALISASALRWHILLISQKVSLPFSWVHGMTYLSVCFNLLVPGALGGDALRMTYTARSVPERKGAVILTIFADRVVGLYGLLALCLVGLLISLQLVLSVAALKFMLIIIAVIVVSGPVLALLLILLLPRIAWFRTYLDTPPKGRIDLGVHAVVDAVRHFLQAKGWLALSMFVSLLAQAIEVFALIWIAMGLGMMTIPVEGFFVAAPLAWTANIIPISPGGLGVGEAAFDQICHWLQPVQTATAFGTVFFINRIFQMIASLPGFVVYILYKQKNHTPVST
jgi:glycosyltransferase 2 family protein